MLIDENGHAKFTLNQSQTKVYQDQTILGFKVRISPERDVVIYNGNTYYIGFSQHPDNNAKVSLFKQFLNTPKASANLFKKYFKTESEEKQNPSFDQWYIAVAASVGVGILNEHITEKPIFETEPTTATNGGKSVVKRNVVQIVDNKLLNEAILQDHHLYPQKYRAWFSQRGIDIDDFAVTIDRSTHLKAVHGIGEGWLPGRYNPQWEEFITNNPNASKQDVINFKNKLLKDFKLDNYSVHK